MLVLKFGGTSVADAGAMRRAASIVAAHRGPRVVVVSALARVTDVLLRLAEAAAAGAPGVADDLSALTRRHRDIAGGVRYGDRRRLLEAGLDGIERSARATLSAIQAAGIPGPAHVDRLLAAGELWGSRLFAALLEDAGVASKWVDARDVVRTDACHLAATPDLEATGRGVDRLVRPWLARDRVVVIGGFIGSAPDGATTTLGRSGSDYSASVVGACLPADEIQIWTDVDGVLSADPRVVPHARLVASLSFESAHELARFGAQVLHPRTIEPALFRNIPIRVLNSSRPAGLGTRIGPSAPGDEADVAAVACRTGIRLVEVVARGARLRDPFVATVFQELAGSGATTILADLCGGRLAVAVHGDHPAGDEIDLDSFCRTVSAFADVRLRSGMAAVCVVGERIGLLAEALTAVRDTPIHLVARPCGRSTLALVVDEPNAQYVVRQLHEALLADESRDLATRVVTG